MNSMPDKLYVTIVEAADIKPTNFFTTSSDTYCSIELKTVFQNGSQFTQRHTQIQKKTLIPKWNEMFEFNLSPSPQFDVLFVSLVASKSLSEKIIGRVEIPISLIVAAPNKPFDCWFKLLETKGKNDIGTPGYLRVIIQSASSSNGPVMLYAPTQAHPLPLPSKRVQDSADVPSVSKEESPKDTPVPSKETQIPVLPPTPSPQAVQSSPPKDSNRTSVKISPAAICPCCKETFPISEIESHVNGCLDKETTPAPPPIQYQAPLYPSPHGYNISYAQPNVLPAYNQVMSNIPPQYAAYSHTQPNMVHIVPYQVRN